MACLKKALGDNQDVARVKREIFASLGRPHQFGEIDWECNPLATSFPQQGCPTAGGELGETAYGCDCFQRSQLAFLQEWKHSGLPHFSHDIDHV
jgi:hypothetical protein